MKFPQKFWYIKKRTLEIGNRFTDDKIIGVEDRNNKKSVTKCYPSLLVKEIQNKGNFSMQLVSEYKPLLGVNPLVKENSEEVAFYNCKM